MRIGGAVALVLVVVLVAGPAAAAVLGGAAVPGRTSPVPGPAPSTDLVDAERRVPSPDGGGVAVGGANLTMRIALEPDGDARWTVSSNLTIEDAEDRRAFVDLGHQWANGSVDAGYDAAMFRRFAERASDASGRSMVVPEWSVERSWSIVGNETGVLVLEFVWTNFGTRSNGQLVVDDAFETSDGPWLPSLEPGQRLVIYPPEGFSVERSPTGFVDGAMTWTGPREFPPGYFVIVLEAKASPTASATASPSPASPTASPTTPAGPPLLSRGVLMGVLAAIVLGGGLALYRTLGGEAPFDRGIPAGGAPTDGGPGTGGDGGATVEEPTAEDPYGGIDPDLLSDEERVLRLLEANGGRMKQGRIVTETGWSNAKVSQLLSGMDEDAQIDKLRIGRENLISLPDVDIEGGE